VEGGLVHIGISKGNGSKMGEKKIRAQSGIKNRPRGKRGRRTLIIYRFIYYCH
jgi:hypothetical protein